MAYAIYRFGDVILPERMVIDDLSTGIVESTLQNSIGSAFDYFGTRTRIPRKHDLDHRGQYVGEITYLVTEDDDFLVTEDGDFLITGDGTQMLQSQLSALKAKIGQRDQLWRRRDADGILQWKTARLLEVSHLQGQERVGDVAPLELRFESAMGGGWRSEVATITAASALAGIPAALTVPNRGKFVVEDAVLRVARTSGTITAVTITGPGIQITWTGSIGVGQTLIIDAGVQTVRRDTTDAYSGFALSGAHTARGWLPLQVGNNVLTVTVTGGNADLSVSHYDQWA